MGPGIPPLDSSSSTVHLKGTLLAAIKPADEPLEQSPHLCIIPAVAEVRRAGRFVHQVVVQQSTDGQEESVQASITVYLHQPENTAVQ